MFTLSLKAHSLLNGLNNPCKCNKLWLFIKIWFINRVINLLIYFCFSRDQVPTISVAPSSVYKAYTTHNSSICSDEGLTLETSAFQSLYGGQFTLSTLLINQIFVFHSPTDAAPQFLQKLTPFTHLVIHSLKRQFQGCSYNSKR